jgi:CheY-like chemotaxis protein
MPQMSAFELLAALRERDAWWTIAVIVLTAKDLAPNERQWLTDHVPAIMPKGAYRRDELLRQIRVRIASGAVGAV